MPHIYCDYFFHQKETVKMAKTKDLSALVARYEAKIASKPTKEAILQAKLDSKIAKIIAKGDSVVIDGATVTSYNLEASSSGGGSGGGSSGSGTTGTTYTLTTGLDNWPGTANNDTFNAPNTAGTAAGQTFNSGDTVTGGAGTDVLNVTIGNAATYVANGVSGVETVNATFSAAGTLSLLGSSGVTQLNASASTAAGTFTNIGSTSVGLGVSYTDQQATFTFLASAVSGTADSATLNLTGVAHTTTNGTTDIDVLSVETLNVVSSTAANVVDEIDATSATTINISGDATLSLATANAVATTITSTNTAGVTLTSNNTAAVTVSGGAGNDSFTFTGGGAVNDSISAGAGNDTITFSDNFANTDSVAGGDGVDTLVIDQDEATGYTSPTTATVSGFEILQLEGALADNLTVATIQSGIEELILNDGAGAFTVTLEAGSRRIELEDVLTADGFTVSDTGTATTDTLVLENGDSAASVFADINIAVNGFETVTIENTGSGAATTQDIGTFTMTPDVGGTARLVLTGSNAMTIEAVTADVIDASGLTRTTGTVFNMTGTPVGVESITGSAGNDVLVGDASSNISGGGGNDTITGGANNDTIAGGTGDDSITSGAGNDTIDAGDGNDTIVVAGDLTQADTIDGGAGTADIMSITSTGLGNVNALSVSNVLTLNANLSNIERVTVSDALNLGAAFDMGRLDNISYVRLAGGYTGNDEQISGLAEGATIDLRAGDTGGANALTLALASTTGTNTINISLTNDNSTDFDGVTVASVEAINITTAEATATSTVETHTLDLTATSLATLTVSGTESLNLYGVDLVASTITTTVGLGVDLQSSGSALTFTGSSSVDAVAGGVGADSITGGSGADDLSGGTGADTIVAGAGADTIAGGAGNDDIDLGSSDAASDVYTSRGGSGTSNIDTIRNFTVGATGGDTLALFGSTDAAAAFLNAGTVSVEEITSLTEAGDANDNVLVLSTGYYANAAAIAAALASGGAITFGSGIAGAAADIVLVYQTASGSDVRVATAEIADTGGIANVQDVAVLAGVTSTSGLTADNFNLDDLYGSAGDDTLTGTSGAETLYGGHGADTIDGGDGADRIVLTETYAQSDQVILGDDDAVTTIVGFGSTDVIGIDVSDFDTELGAGQLVDSSGDIVASDAVVVHVLSDGDTVGAADIAAGANVFFFDDVTGLDGIADLSYDLTLDANTGNAADGIIAIFYDEDDARATIIHIVDAGAAANANIADGASTETVLGYLGMTAAEYSALTAANFAFV
jgi:Ca2+-binding RTX toxin-like protein